MQRRLQVGVIGSLFDQSQAERSKTIANEIGECVANIGAVLLFSHEGDFDSFPQVAAKACEESGGNTMAFLWGSRSHAADFEFSGQRVVTGIERGGGREFVFISSCDVIIAIGGGSGTLTEIAIAYQADIPVIAIRNTGGWSDKLADQFVDGRERRRVKGVNTVGEGFTYIREIFADHSNFAILRKKR